MVKCVVWDMDNTLLAGTYLESLRTSRRPPGRDCWRWPGRSTARHRARPGQPEPARARRSTWPPVTGLPFAAAECGWGRKSDAVRRIMADLGLAADALAFVDDDLIRTGRGRGRTARGPGAVPGGRRRSARAGRTSARPVLTAEARRRGEMYAAAAPPASRPSGPSAARGTTSSGRPDRVTISPAHPADVPRLHELSRAHPPVQLGPAAASAEAALAALLGSAGDAA